MKVKALELIKDQLRIIDQTQLPDRLVYRDLYDYKQVIYAIKRLEIRGAPAIGIAAAYGIAMAVRQSGRSGLAQIRQFSEEFKSSRPTAVNLFWAVDRIVAAVAQSAQSSHEEIVKLLWSEAIAIHDEDKEMCERIGKYGMDLVRDGDTVLTHCNTGALATGGIGTALGIIYCCRDAGKNIRVFADETRPVLQGSRLTAWELKQEGIDVTLICDNTAGMLMRQGRVSMVIVGADRIARNGDTANKIGTYSLAVLAKAHNIPFYIAAPSSTFDPGIPTGDFIVIEERSPEEITEGFGRRTAPKDIPVYAPAFDVTPNELISAFITDEGIKPGGRDLSAQVSRRIGEVNKR
ncbi:MAG: S-methyl-5-thioribose-1-phosphate isomerase [candidate division Zixibacteria bacterium]|nr:S-methyl-5-thioribose-1-phosphate isomerase [candidate division Zixibacteria bacterium]